MAVTVACVIIIDETGYDGDSVDMPNIIRTTKTSSSTGTFSRLGKEFITAMLSSSVEQSVKEATDRLNVIKGDK